MVDGAGINDVDAISPGRFNSCSQKSKRVISFEIDGRLMILPETLANYSNVEIINNDILKSRC